MQIYIFGNEYNICPYETFFGVLIISFISIILGLIGVVLVNDHTVTELIILYPIATLVVITTMMNLRNQSSSAKEVFWGWIILSIGVIVSGGWGLFLMVLFRGM